jgi:hypothetical protein
MAAVAAGSGMAAVPAMTPVTARVHQDHAAEQSDIEDGREGHDAGGDKPGDDDPDRQSGQEPAGKS